MTGSSIKKVTQAIMPKITAMATVVTVLRNNFFLLTGRSFIFSIIKSDWGFFSGSAIYQPCLSVRVLFHTVYSKMQDFHPAFLIFAFTILSVAGFSLFCSTFLCGSGCCFAVRIGCGSCLAVLGRCRSGFTVGCCLLL